MHRLIRTSARMLLLGCALLASAPARADYQPGTTWLKLVEHLHVRANAATVRTLELVMRVDTEAGVDEVAETRIDFSESLETLEILEAATIMPDGRRLPVTPEKIRTLEASDEGVPEFSDAKVKVLIFPSVVVGASIHLRYRITQHTPFFPGHAAFSRYFHPGARIGEATVSISHDPGIALRVLAGGGPVGGRVPAQPDDAPGTVRYRFRYQQDSALPPERNRVALSDFAPFVQATTFADRAALAAAYQARSRPKAEPDESVRRLAAELIAGATSEREKVRRLHRWVSRHIRYVSLAVGTGGYTPNPAASVLEHRYGDCKDHVVLLEAMLRAVGIESTPALVSSDRAMRLPELTTLEPFDHVITYLPSLDLFLDATARFAPMGSLPLGVMDKPVLLTASGKVIRTPRTTAANNSTRTRLQMKVLDHGEIQGESVAEMQGPLEVDSRAAQFANQGKRQEDLARNYLSRFGETGIGRLMPGDPLELDEPWGIRSRFALDAVVNMPGPSAMAIPVGLAPGMIRSLATTRPIGERRFPYFCVSARHREEVVLQWPARVRIERIPADVRFQRGPLRYSATWRRIGQRVEVVREWVADRESHTCTARDDEHWAAMLRVLQRDLRGQIFVR